MYCSNKQFIEIATATGVVANDLHDMLGVVLGLFNRWGSLVKSKIFQDALQGDYPQVVKMIQLLASVDKVNTKSLKGLLSHIDASGLQPFEVTGSTHEKITSTLEKQFGTAIDITSGDSDSPTLQVAGNGRWYKRSLDKDLHKILQ